MELIHNEFWASFRVDVLLRRKLSFLESSPLKGMQMQCWCVAKITITLHCIPPGLADKATLLWVLHHSRLEQDVQVFPTLLLHQFGCNSPLQWHGNTLSPWQIHFHFLLLHWISPFINQGGLDQWFQGGQWNFLPGQDDHHADLIPLIGYFQDLVDPSCFVGAITELSYRRKTTEILLEVFCLHWKWV